MDLTDSGRGESCSWWPPTSTAGPGIATGLQSDIIFDSFSMSGVLFHRTKTHAAFHPYLSFLGKAGKQESSTPKTFGMPGLKAKPENWITTHGWLWPQSFLSYHCFVQEHEGGLEQNRNPTGPAFYLCLGSHWYQLYLHNFWNKLNPNHGN